MSMLARREGAGLFLIPEENLAELERAGAARALPDVDGGRRAGAGDGLVLAAVPSGLDGRDLLRWLERVIDRELPTLVDARASARRGPPRAARAPKPARATSRTRRRSSTSTS
jgi:hypothetical protein